MSAAVPGLTAASAPSKGMHKTVVAPPENVRRRTFRPCPPVAGLSADRHSGNREPASDADECKIRINDIAQ